MRIDISNRLAAVVLAASLILATAHVLAAYFTPGPIQASDRELPYVTAGPSTSLPWTEPTILGRE